jgi:sporulation protein YlmC with PRC-barrel domain
MEQYIEHAADFQHTKNANDLVGLSALTSSGRKLGTVREVRLSKTHAFDGVVVKKGLLGRKRYIGKTYIKKVSDKAVLLSIEPATIHEGRKVVSVDGKVFGKVIKLHRVEHTNQIHSLLVRRRLHKVTIPFSHVKLLGKSIILKTNYEQARKTYGKRY